MGFGSPSLKGKALQWLAQREHSRSELQAKLLRHERNVARIAARRAGGGAGDASADSPAAADEAFAGSGTAAVDLAEDANTRPSDAAMQKARITQVLDELTAAGLQSDTRTAQSLARSKAARYGVHRLKQQLQAKGLAPELVAHTVGESRETEFERALALWRRRYGEPAADAAGRMRQARFLATRGFDTDVVSRVVRGVVDDE